MVTPELLEYIQTSLAGGKSKEQIERELEASGGWKAEDVREAFGALHVVPHITTTSTTPAPKASGAAFIFRFIVFLIILAVVVFAAEKIAGPEINAKIASLIGIGQPAATTTQPQSDGLTNIQPPTSAVVALPQPQDPQATATMVTTPTVVPADIAVNTTCPDDDLNCLATAAATCTPASVKNVETITMFGTTADTALVYGVTGKQGSGCGFSLKNLVNNNDGMCIFKKTTDITNLLKNWQKSLFSTNDFAAATCTGTYFNLPNKNPTQ